MEALKWANKTYIGANVIERASEAKKKLDEGKAVIPGVFLITEAANPANQLEILDSRNLSQSIVRKNLGVIYGMAASKKEAMSVIEDIAAECLEETGGADMRSYLAQFAGEERYPGEHRGLVRCFPGESAG